jgi:protein SCO1/2
MTADTVTIRHEAITNFMAAMSMPFKVKQPGVLAGIKPGQIVRFQLHVSDTESWVDHLQPTGQRATLTPVSTVTLPPPTPAHSPLLDAPFTNELGQVVSLADFHGQALAITFFYTRCPLPDYCPRLSKNFSQASQLLAAKTGLPGNWHFLSITFDPEFDSPALLKGYAQTYDYDPAHWSFLTGSPKVIAELARQSGVQYQLDAGTYNHNFRTLIIDTDGHLQMVFPTGGNLSELIAREMVKALTVTNTVSQK